MSQRHKSLHADAQHKVAQNYRLLGYEVEENPDSVLLPEFMQGVSPDILARSPFDNVVVEVKERSALKGSNNIVGLAERISEHPEWRFELVVLPARRDQARSARVSAHYDSLLKKAQLARDVGLPEMAYIYLANIMVRQGHDLAERHKVSVKGKTDSDLFLDLNFKGVLPEEMTQNCLSVISVRDELARTYDESLKSSDRDLKGLLELCRHLEELL